jgi:hypothetical protein
MAHHLDEIERRITPNATRADPDDLVVIFREIGVATAARGRAGRLRLSRSAASRAD